MIKRLFDITVAGCALALFSPVMLLVAVWIKRDSPGPVFYRGRRSGRGGVPFYMLKFRSMVVDADRLGGPTTAGTDSRITSSGRFVRQYKLDELPQLINVLLGEMSLVGPRPEIVEKVDAYSANEKRILELRPGITDWASIWNSDEGGVLAGVADADAAYEQVIRPGKIKLQLYYLETHSLWSDMKILASTVIRIFYKRYIPREIDEYPDFGELRAEVLRLTKSHPTSAQAA